MTPPPAAILRAQRRTADGQTVGRDLPVAAGTPVRLGREPRGADPDYGADLVVAGDPHVSNFHATLTWDDARLRVVRRAGALNPVFRLGKSDPPEGIPADDFAVGLYDRFRIGDTLFTLLPEVRPIERTCSGDELRAMAFADPAARVEALAELPDLIRLAPDEPRLVEALARVALRGVPRADTSAVVRMRGDEVEVVAAHTRHGPAHDFRPSRRLVTQAIRRHDNVRYVWPDAEPATKDSPTVTAGCDWAVCVRLDGSADEGLYLTGRLAHPPLGDSAALDGDLKFAKLAADTFAALRRLRELQQRDGFLTQLLSPAVRRAVAGVRFEDVVAPREVTATVLFCDLRGFTEAGGRGSHDLLGTWETLSEAIEAMTEAIVAEDGVIGDFQGDSTMGFWGWPLPQPDQIDRAARAALAIRRRFARFAQRPRHPLAGTACGIGVAHGPAVAGRLGAFDQAKIGVFGPVANRASRLEAATKKLRVPILVDEAVAGHLGGPGAPDYCRVRRVARVTPQGFAVPILIAELLPPETEPGPNLAEADRRAYEAALDHFLEGDWDGFQRAAARFPADGPTRFVSAFVERQPDARPPAGWDGGIPVTKPE